MNEDELRNYLREQVSQAKSPYRWAADNNVNRSVVSKVLAGTIAPTPQLVAALGLRRVVIYEEK